MATGQREPRSRQSIWPVKLNEKLVGPAVVAAAIVPDGWNRRPVNALLYPVPKAAV